MLKAYRALFGTPSFRDENAQKKKRENTWELGSTKKKKNEKEERIESEYSIQMK